MSSRVLVLGGTRLACETIQSLLCSVGLDAVSDDTDRPAPVVVMALPSEATWRDLEASGRPAVFIGSPPAPDGITDMVRLGVHAVLTPDADVTALLDAIERLGRGETALEPTQARRAIDDLRRPRSSDGPVALSPRERQILDSIDRGESVKQTATRLGISPRTVDNTQRMLFRKLSARNRAQAIARAHALGLTTPEAS